MSNGNPLVIEAITPAGKRLLEACANVSPSLAERAPAADRAGRMNADNFRDLVAAKVTAAFVPEALGGFGLNSVHDWTLAIAALARADASVAIATNMHLGVSRGIAQGYATIGYGRESLEAVVRGDMLICATATERGTDNLHPLTEATVSADGYVINGEKMFVTMSPVASHLAMNVRLRDTEGDHIASTILPIHIQGISPNDDWDALGMRASGSQSIRFTNIVVPRRELRVTGPWGRWSVRVLVNRALANLPLVGASLGILEAARDLAVHAGRTQKRMGVVIGAGAGGRHLVAELEMLLATSRGVLQMTTRWVDDFSARHEGKTPSMEESHELMQRYQTAKAIVNKAAIDGVNKAMDVVGGSSFTQANTLSRLYRDVRSAPFMQPGAPAEAHEYIGRVALGDWPDS